MTTTPADASAPPCLQHVAALLRAGDVDAAIDAGLMQCGQSQLTALPAGDQDLVATSRQRLLDAWAARDRYRQRVQRLALRKAERDRLRTGPAAAVTGNAIAAFGGGGGPGPSTFQSRPGPDVTTRKRAAKASTPRSVRRKPASRLSPAAVHELFGRLAEIDPEPTTELEYASPFELLVAVILSAQATDVGVNKATRKLYPVANTPQSILALGEDGLKRYISTIGLFNAKAKNVIATCQILIERHDGEVPDQRAALEALPGVGRKTANVVLNTVFGQPTIAVDTHIFRVSNRTGLAPGKDVRAVEDALVQVVPTEFAMGAHHWLILHGRYVCKARKPDCPHCIVRDLCLFKDKTASP